MHSQRIFHPPIINFIIDAFFVCYIAKALSKNIVIYHRGERRVRRVLRLFQPLLGFPDAFAFSVCSAVNFEDIPISLENSTVLGSSNKNHIISKKKSSGTLVSLINPSSKYAFLFQIHAPAGSRTRVLGSASPRDIHYHTEALFLYILKV